ncbi:hypothetical protein B566_EDAN012465 [Ephemera danica]|nr:hypothetical protein B566_EDAN012465 [Ephemera danica]
MPETTETSDSRDSEKEMEEKSSQMSPHASDSFEPADVEEELESYKQYIAVLEKSNHDLETQLKSQMVKSNDEASEARARDGLNKEISDTMEQLIKMEKQAGSLATCCTKLNKLVCDQPNEPVMLYQMPTELIKSSRKKFDSLIKDYMLKQFEEKMLVLAGQQEPATCSQTNPRSLSHFVSGPMREQYQQQCKEFDRLQTGYHSALTSSNLLEAKRLGLVAAIEARLEAQLTNVALDCSFLKVESVVIGNFRVKQRRQQYYIEHLDSLEQLLKQQLALDKFLWTISKVEKMLVGEVCKFLDLTGKHVRTEVDNSIQHLCKMKDLKKLNNQMDLPPVSAEQGKNLQSADSSRDTHAMARSRFVKSSSDALQSHSSNMEQLEQELKLQESKLVTLVADFKHEMERQTELPILKLRDKLWAWFIARPDELAATSANVATAAVSAFSALKL